MTASVDRRGAPPIDINNLYGDIDMDSATTSGERQLSLQELLDLSLGVPEVGAVNFRILKAFLAALINNLGVNREPSGVTNMNALSMVAGDDMMMAVDAQHYAPPRLLSEQFDETSANDDAYGARQSARVPDNITGSAEDRERVESIVELSRNAQGQHAPPPSASLSQQSLAVGTSGGRGTTSSPTLAKPETTADRKRLSSAVRSQPKKSSGSSPTRLNSEQRRRSSGLSRLQQLIQPAILALQQRTEDIEKKLFMLENFPNTGDIVPSLDDAIGTDAAESKGVGTSSTGSVPAAVSSTTAARNSQKTRASQLWQQMKVGQRVDGVERAVEKLFALTDNVVHEMTEQMKATAKMSRRQAVMCKLLAFTGFRRFVANTDDEHLFDETPQTEMEVIYSADGKSVVPQTSPTAAGAEDAGLAGSNATTPSGTMSRYGVASTGLSRLSPPMQQSAGSRRQSQQRQRPSTSAASSMQSPPPVPTPPTSAAAPLEQAAVAASTPGLYFKDYGFVPISKLDTVLPPEIADKLTAADPKLTAFIRQQSTTASVPTTSVPPTSAAAAALQQPVAGSKPGKSPARRDRSPSGGRKQSVPSGPITTTAKSASAAASNVEQAADAAVMSARPTQFSSSDRESLRLLATALQNIVPHYAAEAVIATQDGRLYSEVISASPSPASTPTADTTTANAAAAISGAAMKPPAKSVQPSPAAAAPTIKPPTAGVSTPSKPATMADLASPAAKLAATPASAIAGKTAVSTTAAKSGIASTPASPTSVPTYVPFQPAYASAPITISPDQMRGPNTISPYAMTHKLSLTPPPILQRQQGGQMVEYQPVTGFGQRASSAPPRKAQFEGEDMTDTDGSKTPGTSSGKRPRQEGDLQQPLKKRMAESRSAAAESAENLSPGGANLNNTSSQHMYPEQAYDDGSRSVSPGTDMARPLPVMTWDAFLNGIKQGLRHASARSSTMVGTAFASPPPGEMQDVLAQFGRILSDHDAILNRLHEFENDLDQTRGEWDQRFSESEHECHKRHEEVQTKIADFEARVEKTNQQQLEQNQTVNNRLDRHDSHINHLRSLVEGVTATVDYQSYQMTKSEQQQRASAEELREHVDVKLKEQTDSLVHFIYRQSEIENAAAAVSPTTTTAANTAGDEKQRQKSGVSDAGSDDNRPLPQIKSLSRQKSQTRSKSRGRDDDDEDNKSTTASSPPGRSGNVRMDDFTKLRNNFSAHRRDFLEFERLMYSQMSLLRTRCDDILKDMLRRVGGGAVAGGRPNSASSSPHMLDEDGNRVPKHTKSLHYDFEEALALAIQDIEKLQRIVEELSTNDQLLGTKMRTLGELISRLDDSKASNDFVEHISGRKADRQELAKKLDSSSFDGAVKSIKRDVEQLDQFFHHFEQRVDHMVRRLRDNLASKLDKSEASGAVQSQQALVERFRSMESLVKSSIERVSGDEARAAGTHRPLACISCDKPAAQEFITGMEAALARNELRLTNVMANGVIKPYIDNNRRDDGCSDKDFNEATLARVAHERNVARLLAAQQSWAARWRTEWFDGPPGYPTTGPPALMSAADSGQQQQRWRRICGGDHTTVDKKKQFLKDKDLLTLASMPPTVGTGTNAAAANGNGDENAYVAAELNKHGRKNKQQQQYQQGIGKLMRGLPSTKQKLLILAAQQALAKTGSSSSPYGKQNQSARSSPRNRNTPKSSGRSSPEKRKSAPGSATPQNSSDQPQQLMLTTGTEANVEHNQASATFIDNANVTQAQVAFDIPSTALPKVPTTVAV